MRRKITLIFSWLLFAFVANTSHAQTLIHYWNFNNSATEGDLLTVTSSLVSGASIQHIQGGTSVIQITSNIDQGFEVTNPNARNSDASSTHLRFNTPIGGTLVVSMPTTGYTDIVVKYGTRRSGSGAGTQKIEYTTDGTSYNTFPDVFPVDGNPTVQTLDFSAITAVDNNANFKVRITFEAGSGGTGGNNRFDNFTAEGTGSGPDVTAPVVTFTPADAALHLDVTTKPRISFNEPVRLINNTALSNTNVDALVELRLNNASGTAVTFDATVSGNDIIITPTANLLNNQKYYVALKANSVEDMSDNAVTALQSATFTTIAVQTQFNAGDIVPVAYRMNATATDDEVALLTFVDILPGTMINITDAKYTDNIPAQCAGGFVWTAPANECIPAGSIISIKNDVPLANKGTITGSNFGLGSGGDQFIVYTGTPANPKYITALSSNEWLTANTSCSGGSSKIPATLTDGQTALNGSTINGNVAGNTVNAYYTGTQTGTPAQLRTAILNPANWVGTASATAPQTWPTWNFPGPPAVLGTKIINQTTVQVFFSRDLDNTTATNTANFTGISGLVSITKTNNGILADTLTLTYNSPFTPATTLSITVTNVKDSEGNTMLCPYKFSFTYNTEVSFAKSFITVNENAGTAVVTVNVKNPSNSTVNLVLKGAAFNTASATDFNYVNQTLTITGATTSHVINIPVTDDNLNEQDEYFTLALEAPAGLSITGSNLLTVYIKDNDRKAPVATKEIELSHITSFEPVVGSSTCEIVIFDSATKRLFSISAIQDRLDISDFSNPANITLIKSIDMSTYGGITSVAVKNGIVATASPNANEQLDGSVVFFNTNGDFQKQVTVGALPDMVTFSPDGSKVMTANEGQPNDAYTVDPEGSVSIIDISGGITNLTQANVTTVSFAGFNSQETALIASGVRKLKATSTLAQDFEPEFITISPDSKTAWVTLQENNAVAEINLTNATATSVWSFGTKDFSAMGNGFDASDNNGVILNSNWPIKSFFLADAIGNYAVNGTTYLVTANEGDEKEYAGLTERTTVGAVKLDSAKFPQAAMLQQAHNLGRLRITNLQGDTDTDGDFDELFMVGARSFSIFNATTKTRVFDSGDDFETITAADATYGVLFNADNEGNGFKSRSRAKGPEPEGLTLATISGKTFAFVALERVGGVMAYNITDPTAPTFSDYKNNRSTTSFTGDHGPEGIVYVSPKASPTGKGYVIVANEISGTIAVYEVKNNLPVIPTTGIEETVSTACKLYPNPAADLLTVEYTIDNANEVVFEIYDIAGNKVIGQTMPAGKNNIALNTATLESGVYFARMTVNNQVVSTEKLVIIK